MSDWQSVLRQRQSAWREKLGVPPGLHEGRPLGSRLPAGDTTNNFLTPIVEHAVAEAVADRAKLVQVPRVYENMLSSQPLAFNLFAEIANDRQLATRLGRELWPDLFVDVEAVVFEWSPGRRDPRYLNNRSAFDVGFIGTSAAQERTFVGIEVKYHEDMRQDPGEADNPRLREVAQASGVFTDWREDALDALPLRQIWFDHLLALSMQQESNASHDFDQTRFVLLAPAINERVTKVDVAYRRHLTSALTYERRTLEEVIAVIGGLTTEDWVHAFRERYL